jgi:hypothetical protein
MGWRRWHKTGMWEKPPGRPLAAWHVALCLLLDKRVRWMLGDAGTGLDGNYAVTRCRPWKLPQDKVAPSITRASPGNTRAGGGVVRGGMIIPALGAYATSGKRG